VIRYQTSDAKTVTLELDAALSVNFDMTSSLTKSEIEDGSNIADHVTLDPKRITIDGLISDSPLTIFSPALGLATVAAGQAAQKTFGNLIGAAAPIAIGIVSTQLFRSGSSRAQSAYKILEQIRDERVLCSIVNKVHDPYTNMVLVSLSIPRNAQIGESLRFTATFEQANIVQAQSVPVPKSKVTNPSGASNSELGKNSATQTDAATERSASILKGGLDDAGITVPESGQ
jgi:hypothetical protein